MDPLTEVGGKTPVAEDRHEGVPFDRVESFLEVQLNNNCGRLGLEATMEKISGVNKVVRDTSSRNKPRLILSDKERNEGFKSVSEEFSNPFDGTVLKGDRSESISSASRV